MKILEQKRVGSPGGGWEVHTCVSEVDEVPKGALCLPEETLDHDWRVASHEEMAVIHGKEGI